MSELHDCRVRIRRQGPGGIDRSRGHEPAVRIVYLNGGDDDPPSDADDFGFYNDVLCFGRNAPDKVDIDIDRSDRFTVDADPGKGPGDGVHIIAEHAALKSSEWISLPVFDIAYGAEHIMIIVI